MKVQSVRMYDESIEGLSMASDNKVEVIGEQTVALEDGREVEQYLYNIEGHRPTNGEPFVSLKANIILL